MSEVPLGSLFRFIRNGMNVKQDKSGVGLPITRIETISDAVVDQTRVGFAGLRDEDARDWLLEPGDILFSHINSVQHIGKCAVYRGQPEKLVHGMNLLCFRSDKTKLNPEFAKYLLRSGQFRARLSNCIKKAVNQASVSIGDIQAIPVTLPPLPEQRRIAEILDKADALRAKRRAALAQLDTLTQSIFLDMFASDLRGATDSSPLSDVVEMITVGHVGPTSQFFCESGVPFLRTGNVGRMEILTDGLRFITPGFHDRLKKSSLHAGDLLVSRVISDEVRCGIVPPELENANCANVIIIRTGTAHVLPEYLAYLIYQPESQSTLLGRQVGSAQAVVNTKVLQDWRIPVPPMDSQRSFSRAVANVRHLKVTMRRMLAECDALFATLQHQAFRGGLAA